MAGFLGPAVTEVHSWGPGAQENLDRALVAGVMLDAVLHTPDLLSEPQARRRQVKGRLQDLLVAYLAGRVTLDRFRTLMSHLDRWFALYYPLLPPAGPLEAKVAPDPPCPSPWKRQALRDDLLEHWLHGHRGILPRRRHRKFHEDKLRAFLNDTQGGWFRLKDFQQHFDLDRKTAWEYLQKLRQAGLLDHNRGRATAVRYCLAPQFLVIQAHRLRPRLAQALAHLPRELTARVADWLLATAGEAFWEKEMAQSLPGNHLPKIIEDLKAANLLEEVGQWGPNRLLRLPGPWLKEADG